jgi:hypothetical protein
VFMCLWRQIFLECYLNKFQARNLKGAYRGLFDKPDGKKPLGRRRQGRDEATL